MGHTLPKYTGYFVSFARARCDGQRGRENEEIDTHLFPSGSVGHIDIRTRCARCRNQVAASSALASLCRPSSPPSQFSFWSDSLSRTLRATLFYKLDSLNTGVTRPLQATCNVLFLTFQLCPNPAPLRCETHTFTTPRRV